MFRERSSYEGSFLSQVKTRKQLSVMLWWNVSFACFPDSLFEQEREPVNAKIYMHGDLAWNDFKIMICRSTTPDIVKMVAKIQEFVAQQHRNSIRALSSLRPHIPLITGDVMSSLSTPVSTGSQVKEENKDGWQCFFVLRSPCCSEIVIFSSAVKIPIFFLS